jgi:hypothetical protein
MFLFKLVLALAIIVGALFLVFRFHRQIQAGSGGSKGTPGQKEEGARATELEEFIAAYRRDKATGQAQPSAASAQPAAVPATTAGAAASAAVKARAAFLSGPAKLAFLVLKAGLPDHHVFANTRVSDLMDGPTVPALANLPVDLVVCSKDLAIVAAVDLNTGQQAETLLEREKEQRLRAAGIRYLRFAPGAFPKPAEVRKLVYGE